MKQLAFAACAALSLAACSSNTTADNPCPAEIEKINEALARTTMTPEASQQIDAMMKKGDALCKEGKYDKGMASLAEAKKLLGVQ
jgi:hypothetical protein